MSSERRGYNTTPSERPPNFGAFDATAGQYVGPGCPGKAAIRRDPAAMCRILPLLAAELQPVGLGVAEMGAEIRLLRGKRDGRELGRQPGWSSKGNR